MYHMANEAKAVFYFPTVAQYAPEDQAWTFHQLKSEEPHDVLEEMVSHYDTTMLCSIRQSCPVNPNTFSYKTVWMDEDADLLPESVHDSKEFGETTADDTIIPNLNNVANTATDIRDDIYPYTKPERPLSKAMKEYLVTNRTTGELRQEVPNGVKIQVWRWKLQLPLRSTTT